MAEVTETRLVRNSHPGNHLEALRDVISTATTISMAVAFLKSKGLDKIIGSLRTRLNAGAAIEMFIGRDFCLTEPEPLKDLLELSKRYPSLEVFVAKADARSTFHPKLYLGANATAVQVLLGSANLTGGALTANDEISAFWKLGLEDAFLRQLQDVFLDYRSNDRFDELDDIVLDQYRRQFKLAQDMKRRVEKELASADSATFDLARLAALHQEFSLDQNEILSLERRRHDHKAARSIQRKIANLSKLPNLSPRNRQEFESLFRDLVTSANGHRHLWHSGDIHRRGQEALKQPKQTVALFALAEIAAKLPPEEGYARVRTQAHEINGVGINMVSEILCTFAPKRYAVFNGNTAGALRMIGAEPPRSVNLFSPAAYARICGIVDAVRKRIGEDDLSDADAFLNWIYQRKVKNAP